MAPIDRCTRLFDTLPAVAKEAFADPADDRPLQVVVTQSLARRHVVAVDAVRDLLWLADKVGEARTPEQLRLVGGIDRFVTAELTHELFNEAASGLLTGVWLGMYFLGMPFHMPWERALALAEATGGFPRGPCIHKAVGDVYRTARRIYLSDFAETVEHATRTWRADASYRDADGEPCARLVRPPGVVAFTRRPQTVFTASASASNACLPAFTELAKLYVQLQIRLYVQAGLPISMFVTDTSIRSLLALPPADVDDRLKAMCAAIGASAGPAQCIVVVEEQDATHGVPTCVIGHHRGLSTISEDAGGGNSVHIAGQRFSAEVAAGYRRRLARAAGTLIQWSDPADLLRRLQACVPPTGAPQANVLELAAAGAGR